MFTFSHVSWKISKNFRNHSIGKLCHWSSVSHELSLWQPKVNWSRSERSEAVSGSGGQRGASVARPGGADRCVAAPILWWKMAREKKLKIVRIDKLTSFFCLKCFDSWYFPLNEKYSPLEERADRCAAPANIADRQTHRKGKLRSAWDNMHEEFCNSDNLIRAWWNNLLKINSLAPNQHHKRIRSWIKIEKGKLESVLRLVPKY